MNRCELLRMFRRPDAVDFHLEPLERQTHLMQNRDDIDACTGRRRLQEHLGRPWTGVETTDFLPGVERHIMPRRRRRLERMFR